MRSANYAAERTGYAQQAKPPKDVMMSDMDFKNFILYVSHEHTASAVALESLAKNKELFHNTLVLYTDQLSRVPIWLRCPMLVIKEEKKGISGNTLLHFIQEYKSSEPLPLSTRKAINAWN